MLNLQQQELELKKLTLVAWAKLLLNTGKIPVEKYNQIVSKIDKTQK